MVGQPEDSNRPAEDRMEYALTATRTNYIELGNYEWVGNNSTYFDM